MAIKKKGINMSAIEFRTKTMIMPRRNTERTDVFVLGIDIGYSAVKGFASNKVFCFPSYARRVSDDRISLKEPSDTDIMYRDNEGTWVVGDLAYEEVNASDVMDSETELFGRHRFFSPMFQVILRTALGIGLLNNEYGSANGKRLFLQSGLPTKYEKADSKDLLEVMATTHEFELKIGKSKWISFTKEHAITLNNSQIGIMPQPMGALISASVDFMGRPVPSSKKYFEKKLIVFDPGFGTLDDYTINKGTVVKSQCETFPEYGMREVFSRTVRDIEEVYGVSIQIPELQNKLVDGKVRVVDRRAMKAKEYSFESILEKNCKEVFTEAMEKMKSAHNYFADIGYIIATGGTYDAWQEEFAEIFKEMDGLQIIPANCNDSSLSNVFSNVRGYFYYCLNRIPQKK